MTDRQTDRVMDRRTVWNEYWYITQLSVWWENPLSIAVVCRGKLIHSVTIGNINLTLAVALTMKDIIRLHAI